MDEVVQLLVLECISDLSAVNGVAETTYDGKQLSFVVRTSERLDGHHNCIVHLTVQMQLFISVC